LNILWEPNKNLPNNMGMPMFGLHMKYIVGALL
jgi:hypothetical protein